MLTFDRDEWNGEAEHDFQSAHIVLISVTSFITVVAVTAVMRFQLRWIDHISHGLPVQSLAGFPLFTKFNTRFVTLNIAANRDKLVTWSTTVQIMRLYFAFLSPTIEAGKLRRWHFVSAAAGAQEPQVMQYLWEKSQAFMTAAASSSGQKSSNWHLR